MRNQIDKIIITAMDRFVWFVLLVVMSHLVTEFTRVTGYARGNRNDVIIVNDSLINPMQVQNLVLYPGQDYGLFEQANSYSTNNNNNNNNNNKNNREQSANFFTEQQGMLFSFRPIIDSIFEIPISTLKAVNNLVARLTGNYQQAPSSSSASSSGGVFKSTGRALYSSSASSPARGDSEKLTISKKSVLPEQSA